MTNQDQIKRLVNEAIDLLRSTTSITVTRAELTSMWRRAAMHVTGEEWQVKGEPSIEEVLAVGGQLNRKRLSGRICQQLDQALDEVGITCDPPLRELAVAPATPVRMYRKWTGQAVA